MYEVTLKESINDLGNIDKLSTDIELGQQDIVSKPISKDKLATKLYELIVALAYAWKTYSLATTSSSKTDILVAINMLEIEKSRIIGMLFG